MFPRDCRGPLHCPCGTITKSTSQGERPNSHEVTTDDIHREASAAARKTFGPSTRQQVPFFPFFFQFSFVSHCHYDQCCYCIGLINDLARAIWRGTKKKYPTASSFEQQGRKMFPPQPLRRPGLHPANFPHSSPPSRRLQNTVLRANLNLSYLDLG
jgi:hypothetical protein